MANRWKGNFVVATAATSSGTDYTGKANGAWGLNNQLQQKQGGLWAKGLTVPGAPTIGTAVYGDTSATVPFTAPSDTGGQSITGYIATSTPSNITASSTGSPITVTGLTNGTSYTFKVAAINASGAGTQSVASNAVTPSGLTAPSEPTIGTATLSGNTSAIITFTPPSNTGGTPITGYTVTSSPNGLTSTGVSSPITITGLSGGTNYTFTVTATNAIGTSSPSSASNSITTPLVIGQAYGGGFYAGKISNTANGVATHYLVVAPKSSGETSKTWGAYGVTTGITSVINGSTNSASLAALGVGYEAATFCEGLTIGGYNDWYLPAKQEMEVIYYFLKPSTAANNVSFGANPYAVSPEPINTNYTSGSPTQTSAGIGFREGETQAFVAGGYWNSTEFSAEQGGNSFFGTGISNGNAKYASSYVRAIRKIPI